MPADPANQLAFPQLGDTETAIPVSSAEQQATVVRHDQHLSADVDSRRERSAQETLSSATQSRIGKNDQSEF